MDAPLLRLTEITKDDALVRAWRVEIEGDDVGEINIDRAIVELYGSGRAVREIGEALVEFGKGRA